MALSPYWRGFIRLSLVSVPVRAYTAFVSGGGEIHFNQLHAECHSRIQYKKTCPAHGEVSNDQIVSGFQYAKDQYVVVDPDELDKLRTEDEKAVNITAFVSPDTVDPIYLTGSTYYLVPDAPVGQRPYAVLRQAMIEENRYAVAHVVIHGKEHTVLLRPMDNVLAMSTLSYENRVTKPSAFEDQAPSAQPSPEEAGSDQEADPRIDRQGLRFRCLQGRVHREADEGNRSQGRRRGDRGPAGKRARPHHQLDGRLAGQRSQDARKGCRDGQAG
jgi:DNA end-binding protein Ku